MCPSLFYRRLTSPAPTIARPRQSRLSERGGGAGGGGPGQKYDVLVMEALGHSLYHMLREVGAPALD